MKRIHCTPPRIQSALDKAARVIATIACVIAIGVMLAWRG